MSHSYLQVIDEINKAACARGALVNAIDTGKVFDLSAYRRHIQDNAQPLPNGRSAEVQHVEKLQ